MSQCKAGENQNGIPLPPHAQNGAITPQRKKLAVDRSSIQAALNECYEIKAELKAELKAVNRQIFDLSTSLARDPK